jgi:mannan endo-1,4-beta-mannosidase
MNKALLFLLLLMLGEHSFNQTLVATVEAESGVLTGVNIAAQTSNSSGTYVTGFDAAGDKVTVTVTVTKSAIYDLIITYRGNQGQKIQDLYVNGASDGSLTFPSSTNFVPIDAGGVWLNAGSNTIAIVDNWGYMDVDKFTIYTTPLHTYNIVSTPIDTAATPATKNLYSYLLCQFNKNIISGITADFWDSLKNTSTKSPMIKTYDFTTYTAGYPYNWANGSFAFGAVPSGATEQAIAWYNSTNKKGIVGFHWHWCSPSGGTVGTNTFSTTNTTFDIRQAVIPGTQQNKDAIRDIDVIAVELLKLQTANVPILWRPLHEAGGAWFWWGAQGSTPCLQLLAIMYDRLTNYHKIHNLIWEWSTPEPSWYPGNTKIDIVGYDSYPGVDNYTVQKPMFDQLYTIVGGQKLIAMTECGPIPDIQKCFDMDAPWAYFMTWSDLTFKQNTVQHIDSALINSKVLTVENTGIICSNSQLSIPLTSGWNFISTNIIPADSSVATIFNGLDVQEIKTADVFWEKGQSSLLNSLKYISAGSAYLVKMNTVGNLVLIGIPISIPGVYPSTTTKSGWNLIGCPFQSAIQLSNYYNTSNSKMIKNFTGFWISGGATNSITTLDPGKGYYLKK